MMTSPLGQYELLGFGNGRRLERMGEVVLDRPSPSATGVWQGAGRDAADLVFELQSEHRGQWWISRRILDRQPKWNHGRREWEQWGRSFLVWDAESAPTWECRLSFGTLQLKATDFGHVGLFPEHLKWWQRVAADWPLGHPGNVLSLFAYTGGSTLSLASVGARVTHVEAARNVVQWARTNAERSQAEALPIRWLCEDAPRYVSREVKRHSEYEGFILDPPSYGHGPKGQVWRIQRDLPALLNQLARIASPNLRFVLLSAHSSDCDPPELRNLFLEHFLRHLPEAKGRIVAEENLLILAEHADSSGSRNPQPLRTSGLPSGAMVLWQRSGS